MLFSGTMLALTTLWSGCWLYPVLDISRKACNYAMQCTYLELTLFSYPWSKGRYLVETIPSHPGTALWQISERRVNHLLAPLPPIKCPSPTRKLALIQTPSKQQFVDAVEMVFTCETLSLELPQSPVVLHHNPLYWSTLVLLWQI